MMKTLRVVLSLVLFCSSCENAPSKTKQANEILPEMSREHEEEEGHFHDTPKDIKFFPPLAEKEAEYYRKLLKDTHIEIQLASASVLMSHGDRSGEPVLLELLKGENQHLRIDSFLKLAERPTKKLIPQLQEALEKEKDTMARFVMKRALRKAQKKLEEYEKEIPRTSEGTPKEESSETPTEPSVKTE